jgi:hypothetical protein
VFSSEIPPTGKAGRFGTAIAAWHDAAANADWVVVGAPRENAAAGAVYVFSRADGGNTWQQQAQLTANDASSGSVFGESVAIDGDTIVVGSPLHVADFMTGAVYVFTRDPATSSWSQQGDGLMTGKDGFGSVVVLKGDMLAASSPKANEVSSFERVGSTWSPFFTISAPTEVIAGSFGWSLAITDSQLLVGAPDDASIAHGQGSATLYSLGRSSWDLEQIFRPQTEVTSADQHFGFSVAMSDQLIVIGAPWYPPIAGYIHMFTSTGGTYVEDGGIIDFRSSRSGSIVATQGDRVAEAPVDGDGDDYCYIFHRDEAGRYPLESVIDGDKGTAFCSSMAFVNGWLIVGAMGSDGADGDAFAFLPDRIFADGVE